MTEKYGFIYIWRDRKHKRYYVGSHWGTINDGYVCSSPWMNHARDRRINDFKRRIVQIHHDRQTLKDLEEQWLALIKPEEMKPKTTTPRYYNLSLTAKNAWHYRENDRRTVGQKISEAKKGKNTGPRDPSVGEAISKAKKGKAFTEEHKAALAKAQLGTKQSEETKAKRAASLREAWASGRMTGVRGKKLTRQKPSSCTS